MDFQQITLTVMGFLISIIGYFLQRLLQDHEKTKEMAIKNQAKLDLVENNHSHLSNKFDELYDAVKDLTAQIRELTIQLAKNNK